MSQELQQLLSSNHIAPVLVDVGASAKPPAIWSGISPVSIYLGFDPDSRDFQSGNQPGYAHSFKFNFAVGAENHRQRETLFLTKSPYCSSLLRPIAEELENYTFAEEFAVDSVKELEVIPLAEALAQSKLDRIDWLKLDSQGLDFAIYRSLPATLKSSVLALDMEPGLVPAYQGEDLFSQSHQQVLGDGFWLASMQPKGVPRLSTKTAGWLKAALADSPGLPLEKIFRESPVWCNVLYLRSAKWLENNPATKDQLIILWSFCALLQLWGFAFEILRVYQQLYDEDQNFLRMQSISAQSLNGFRNRLRRAIPARVARHLVNKVWGE